MDSPKQHLFPKIWEITESHEEYVDLTEDVISGAKKALDDLKDGNLSFEIAHKLVNKCIYLADHGLIDKCKKMELHCRNEEDEEALELLSDIEEELYEIFGKHSRELE